MGETEDKTSTLIQSIGRGMADSVPPGRARLELRVSGAGGMTDSRLTVVASDTTEDRTPTLVKQARRAVATLRKTMFQPGNGTWYNATFTITPEGNLEARVRLRHAAIRRLRTRPPPQGRPAHVPTIPG